MDNAKVLCVSEASDNLLMWSHYAENHKGAVIKFRCSSEMDNPLCAATKVRYQKEMPVIATLDEWIDSSFGFKSLDYQHIWHKIFSTKSLDWAYEREWRVIIPNEAIGATYSDIKIFPEEVDEIIFGCRMTANDTEEILTLLTKDFGHVSTIKATKNFRKFCLDFKAFASK